MARISHLYAFLLACHAIAGEKIGAPKVWVDKHLAEWATPVAGLNARPGHFSEREYNAAPPAEYFRSYPVYIPGREPAGYLEKLAAARPEPLVPAGKRTRREWIEAGRIAFREVDVAAARSYDPDLIAAARSAEALAKAGARPQADATVAGLRWVPTTQGLALSVSDCGGCHSRVLPDGSRVDGVPFRGSGNAILGQLVTRTIKKLFADDAVTWNWRSSAVPWVDDDIHARIPQLPPQDLRALFRGVGPGTFARFNGSPYYPTKVPDLIGIPERKYLDHTATHRHRDITDLMRYGALVGCCDSGDFGPHRMLTDQQRTIHFRFPDEVLFAIAQYIYALEPPANPNAGDPRIMDGQAVFEREGCGNCHTPPAYTNNKLTLAEGYRPPGNHPLAADILPVTVGTHPGLALKTRKGTGLYKVPSLKGVWYRGLFNHDGSVKSLEEWFDSARLADPRTKGHEFGLNLNSEDRAALLAFLRSL